MMSILVTFVLACSLRFSESSHFRGGMITWKPDGNKITITYRVAFRRDYSSDHMCDQQGDLMNGEGTLSCYNGCTGNIVSPMSYICTDYSIDENWSTGQRVVEYSFPTTADNVFVFRYTSCCWISSLIVGSSSWVLKAVANINLRNDIGRINTSPVSAMQPIVRLKLGCNYDLRIPVADDDGDIIRCRWGESDECFTVCNGVPGAVLEEDACVLRWTPTTTTGLYAVALQIEDFSSTTQSEPYSSVPLQFLLDVSTTTDSCGNKPQLGNDTNINDTVTKLEPDATFFKTLIANTGSTSVSITEFLTVSPIGTLTTPVAPFGTSGTEWYINVTWTPSPDQSGSHIFCYAAVNSLGQSSDQACITVEVPGLDFCNNTVTRTEVLCQNGGTCLNGLQNYTCLCPASYTGDQCMEEINLCEGATCYNGGSCVAGSTSYNCSCPASHTGDHCQTDIDFCNGTLCLNGGTCIDGLFTYHCSCPQTKSGTHCELGTENKGTEFIFGYIPNAYTSDPKLEIFITTDFQEANVQISTPLFSPEKTAFTVKPGQVHTHVVRTDLQGIAGNVEGKGIYVVSDKDIVVYANNKEEFSTDSYLVLPTDVLGKEHNVISYDERSTFMVVGADNGTEVTLHLSTTSVGVIFNETLYKGGETFAVILDKFQTVLLSAIEGDLTGTYVVGSKPIAVVSGSICAKIGGSSCDHLVQQIPSIDKWGTEFVTVGMPGCSQPDTFKIVSSVANTFVNVQGYSNITLIKPGDFYSVVIPNIESRIILANYPIAVVLFVHGNCNETQTGDPSMIIIPPINQYSSDYTFLTVDLVSKEFENFVVIVISDDFIPGLRLDNNAIHNANWSSVNGRNDIKFADVKISSGAHTLRHIFPTVTFMAISTGIQHFISYGYTAGFRFHKQTPNCSEVVLNSDGGFGNDSCYFGIDPCQDVQCMNNGICEPVGWIDFVCTCTAGYTGRLCHIDIDYCHTSNAVKDILCENGGTCLDGLLDYSCLCPDTHTGDFCEDEISSIGYVASVVVLSTGLALSGGIMLYAVYNVFTTVNNGPNMAGYSPFD